jgi:hypothetical protein
MQKPHPQPLPDGEGRTLLPSLWEGLGVGSVGNGFAHESSKSKEFIQGYGVANCC